MAESSAMIVRESIAAPNAQTATTQRRCGILRPLLPREPVMPVRTIATITLLAAACAAPPSAQAADEVTGTMLVANKRGNSLARVDLATGAKTHEVATCANPHELAVSPDRVHVALACYSGQELEILRTADLGLVKRIQL